MKTLVFAIACAVLGILPVANAASKDQSPQDQAFVNAAARGGKWEVELGKLAQQNAPSPDVKQFGAKMVTDHTKLNTELGSVATSIGLTVPTDLSPQQQAEYKRLSKLSGTKFDKAYMDLMVKAHTDDLAAFQQEEATTQNQKLKKAVANAILVVKEHLNMAKSDSAKLGSAALKVSALRII
jgi:putative membrane protein